MRFVFVVYKIKIILSFLSSFVVKVRKDGELSVECSINLDISEDPSSCGYSGYVKEPCFHLYTTLRSVKKPSLLKNFGDASWT